MSGIQYLTYQQIDKKKWDACINNAGNGLIYGYSTYLDAMAKNWDGLVLNNYEAVMPLTWNKKYGIYYLYQPPFAASLGVFGLNITPLLVNDFLAAVPKKFKFWDIYLNYGNHFSLQDFTLYERMNYVLPLNEPYQILYSRFRENTQRNIKKCEQLKCVVKKNIAVSEVIALSKEQSKSFSKLTDYDFERIEKLYGQLRQEQKAVTYGIYNNKQLVASAAFFFSHKRAYYILVGNHPNARPNDSSSLEKRIGASHALINAFIKDYAGQNLLLDFEGSDIRNLAFFYSSFGAREEKFAGIKLNRLPLLLKLIKKWGRHLRASIICSATIKSNGFVILKLFSAPSTRCTFKPNASTTVASSVNLSL